MSDHVETDTPLPLPESEPKKRVRASIADTVTIARVIQEHGECRFAEDGDAEVWSYEPGYSDARIAKECVPHLAAHHVASVREAVFPRWEKRPSEMPVEDQIAELREMVRSLDARMNNEDTDILRRLVALERRALGLDPMEPA